MFRCGKGAFRNGLGGLRWRKEAHRNGLWLIEMDYGLTEMDYGSTEMDYGSTEMGYIDIYFVKWYAYLTLE